MNRRSLRAAVVAAGSLLAFGCGPSQPSVNMAPPVGGPPAASAPAPGQGGVYNWQDVPPGQQVPVQYARFDQGGYQIYAATGETIVVPFVNQNLYVMKFGRSNSGQMFFVNEGGAPTLYLPPGGFLENAAAQNARWYPIPADYNYTRPIYVSLAPSWADFVGMGWYPGMNYYGGLWGYGPGLHFTWMPGFYVHLGGQRYTNYVSYRNYYTTHRNYAPMRSTFNYSTTRSTGSFGAGRATSSTGSYRPRGFGGSASSSTGSFGSGRSFGGGSTGSFGAGRSSGTGSFSGSSSRPRGSFGGGIGSFGGGIGSFGGTRPSSGSTGSSFGGTRGFGGSGGSFGGSGGSFGGGRSSFGGSSGRRSSFGGSGGSFGRRR